MLQDYKVRLNGVVYQCVDRGFGRNTEVDAVVRPEDIDIVPAEGARVSGRVVSVVFMGVHYEVDVDCGGYEWVIQTTDYVAKGALVGISIPPDAIHIMKKTQQTNLFDAVAYPDDGEVEFCGKRFACSGLEGFETKDDVLAAIAPADVRLTAPQESELTGFVKACMFLGTHYEVSVTCGEEEWIAYSDDYMEPGEETGVDVEANRISVSANEAE
jgi:spermidine/putrescine transport system ATP-binding protein